MTDRTPFLRALQADGRIRSPPRAGRVGSVLMDRIRDEWYPAWDSGDPERFVAVTRDVFAPDAQLTPKPGAAPASVEELLPGWLGELQTWRPQHHEVVFAVEDGDGAAWTMRWQAMHSGDLHLPDGRVLPATGRTVNIEAGFFARCDGQRITSLQAYSDYAGLLAELTQDA